MEVVPMTLAFARDVVTWRYAAPYDCYDMTSANPEFLADPGNGFHALVTGEELIGFRSFGPDGRVPGWDYDDSALDTGGGLRPDLTDKGLGLRAIRTGLEFGQREFSPAAFRMTIASFNVRAQTVIGRLGFAPVASFTATTDGAGYTIFLR